MSVFGKTPLKNVEKSTFLKIGDWTEAKNNLANWDKRAYNLDKSLKKSELLAQFGRKGEVAGPPRLEIQFLSPV